MLRKQITLRVLGVVAIAIALRGSALALQVPVFQLGENGYYGFRIPTIVQAKNGDLLVFKVFAYKPDTVLLTDLSIHEIFMEPVTNQLKEVNINSTTTKNMNTYYDPRFHGQPLIYAHDEKFNYKGGVVWRLWWWKKDQKKKDKLEAMQRKYDAMDKIYAVFQPSIISQYIPLTGQDLDNFITLYTPSPEVVSKKSFNLSNYLNDCLKKYQKLPPDKRIPAKLSE